MKKESGAAPKKSAADTRASTKTTVRVDVAVKKYLEHLAKIQKSSISKVLRQWTGEHKLREYKTNYERGYDQLHRNKLTWRKELSERSLWERTSFDELSKE